MEEFTGENKFDMADETEKRPEFCVNDNMDVLIEILKRLDDRSLGVAACVCRIWCSLTRNESLWEHLCFRQLSPPPEGVRAVVVALGGYRRLYMGCVKPVRELSVVRESDRVWTRHEVELSLSLFCVDYYERVLLGGGGRLGSLRLLANALLQSCECVMGRTKRMVKDGG